MALNSPVATLATPSPYRFHCSYLIALHHAAGEKQNGQWISNEGIRVDKIVADLRNHFSGSPSGDAVLAELGI